MLGRIIVLGVALSILSAPVVFADDPGEAQDVPIPVVMEEEIVVSAAPAPYMALTRTSIAAGIGMSWGKGTLNFDGENHPFTVKGLSVGDLGASKIVAKGAVSNLDNLSDFEGRYLAAEAGIAAGKGSSTVAMRNDKGVVITLSSEITGAQLTLAAQGFSIKLK